MRVFLCGGVAIEAGGRRLPDAAFAGRQGRLVLAYLVCERHRSVPREELAELLWGEPLPSSWSSSLSAVVSKLRRLLTDAGLDGPAALASAFGSYRLHLPDDTWIDWETVGAALEQAERAVRDGQTDAAVAAAAEVEEIARRGFITDDCLWADAQRERLRDMQVRAAHVRAEAHLLAGEQRRAVEIARDALGLDAFREGSYRLLMRALAAAGERGEALRVWERCRTLLVEELGTDPATETEAVYLSILGDVAPPPPSLPSGVVTFLLTDIVDSTGLWERNPIAMATALERHDRLVADTVGASAGVLLKAKLEGDATVSVFPRASAGAMAALALREALLREAWPEGAAPEVRMALHTGEAIERDGDYFGPALDRAARLRGLASGGQILVSQAVAEVVRDHLPEGTVLRSLGERALRGLTRDEHVFELAPLIADDVVSPAALERPALATVLAGSGAFVGRVAALEGLAIELATAMAGTARGLFIAGEPGVGKTRLAGEAARRAYDQGALVLYGRCDEELGAPYQPFAEALRALVGCLGARRLRSVRGVEELARLVPELADLVPGLPLPAQSSPDTERYALFDAFVRMLTAVSAEMPVVVVIDDLHWAAKPTLLLLRHLLRSAEGARILIVGTYRHTDLDRTHPLAGMLADLHSDGTAERFTLTGLEASDVNEYLSASGYDDERLGDALSTVTSGNPFFLIEVLRHVEESGGEWKPSTLPQGIREAVGRRLSRLSDAANDALSVAAVAGSQFSVALVERVLDRDLIDAIDEACHAGLIVEEADGWCRFNHALVRQSLVSEIASLKRVRLHLRIAEALEADGDASREDHLADLARHYFECALAGGAAKAVDYSRRAAEQATARLAYEVAAELYDRALQAADISAAGASDDDKAELLMARCEALLAAGDVTAAIAVVEHLERAARTSPRLSAWATCFAGQLAVLTHPERLDATAQDVAAAAEQFALMEEPDGEAKAHTVRATCLARLGRVADCEAALDRALTAGRRAGDPRRVNAVLAGAPLAALWGPSPVARASGRCLDVVRVLRITTGSPAVEAVALRCQAVLEALRGRTDAARRMLGSAHRSLEALGHIHGLLETDLFSGMVELLAGEPGTAEIALRRAYEGFVTRGVGVDAAQAAALLARAVLAQGRVDEALTLTDDSERLAGVDLQSAIAWRAARAEALVQQERTAEALEAARAAVALADPTDALIDQADAHLSLAIVLRAADNLAEAAREARRAIDLYERKGATARVDAVHSMLNPRASTESVPEELPAAHRRVRGNRGIEVEVGCSGPFGEQSVDQWLGRIADDYVEVDHRTQVTSGADAYERTVHMYALMERFTFDVEPLASLGDHHALVRNTFHMEGALLGRDRAGPLGDAEIVLLEVARTDHMGRIVRAERFEGDELHLALARLIELHADDELPPEQRDAQYRYARQHRLATIDWNSDAVLVDHRPASLGTLRGTEEIKSAAIALRSLGADLRRITDVLALTERISLVEVLSEGTSEGGGPVEVAVVALTEMGEDGDALRWDWYGLDQVDEALARFDELVGDQPAVSRLANMASVELRSLYDALLRRDFASIDATTADNAAVDDHRSLFRDRFEGHDATVSWLRSIVAAGVTDIEIDVLATRGECVVLERDLYRGRDAEGEVVVVAEFSPHRRWLGYAGFDPGDLDAAFDELDARYSAGEGAPFVEAWEVTTAASAAFNNRAWDAYRSLLADDFVTVDHRTAGWGTLDREANIAALRGLVELAPDARMRHVAVVRQTVDGGITVTCVTGTDATGGRFEIALLALRMTRHGRFSHGEFFAVDDLTAACARLDALTTPAVASYLTNQAERAWSELMARFVARDWDGFASRLAEGVVADDRRPVIGVRVEGRDAFVDLWRGIAAVGVTGVELTPLATRGNRLVLQSFQARGDAGDGNDPRPGADDWTIEAPVSVLFVHEFDDNGLHLGRVSFDPSALDAAFDELDARYAAGEAAPFADAWAVTTATIAAHNSRDWDAYRALLADDFVTVDHRTAGWGTLDGEAFLATLRGLVELAPDFRIRHIAVVRQTVDGGITVTHLSGTDATGGLFEMEYRALRMTTGGRLVRQEFFDSNDLAAASARLDALTTPAVASYLTNHAERAWSELMACFVARDWDGFAAKLAEGAVADDRRSIIGGVSWNGRAAFVDMWRGIAAVGVTDVEWTPLATRGDRLVLQSFLARGSSGEGALLFVHEFDDDGLYLGGVSFDPDAFDAAFDELDARYAAGQGAPFVDAWAATTATHAAYNSRDWDALEAQLTDDFVFVDHQPAGWGALDRKAFVATLRGLVELSSDVRLRMLAIARLTKGGAAYVLRLTGTNETGGSFEIERVVVETSRAGRYDLVEFFAIDDLNAACDRLDALTTPPVRSHLNNDAVRHWRRMWDLQLAAQWDEFSACTAADVILDDRRRLIGGRAQGREDVLEWMKEIGRLGATAIDGVTLATRGEQLVLQRDLFRGAGFEVEVLAIYEYAPDGRWVATYVFDPDDLDAAFDELDARYAAGEGGPVVDAWAATTAANAAYNSRDWHAFEARLTDDFVCVDHQPAGWGTLDRAAFVATIPGLVELSPDVRVRLLAIARLTDSGVVYAQRLTGTNETGGPFEIDRVVVGTSRNGRYDRLEFFAVDDLVAARDRLDALTAQSVEPDVTNDATRHWSALMACFRARDWDGLAAGLADDATAEDRRSLVGRVRGVYAGRDACVAMWREFAAVGCTDVVGNVIATRGDRLLLERALFVAGDAGEVEVEVLLVVEFDDHGRYLAALTFDPHDLDAALAELDARYAAEAGSHLTNYAVRGAIEGLDHLVRADWDWYRGVAADDVVIDDRRRYVGYTAVGLDDIIKFSKAVVDAGVTEVSTVPIATRGDRLALLRNVYRGAAAEAEMLNVWEFDAEGRWLALISFDPDDLDAAFAELDTRFATGEAAAYADELWCLRTFIDAANRVDSAAVASLFAEDFVVVDHRSMGLGEVGGAAMLDYVASVDALVTHALARYTAIPRIATGRVMSVFQLGGTSAEGAEIEIPYLSVVSLRGRKAHRLEMFPLEQADAADELFDALLPGLDENTAAVLSRQLDRLLCAEDWEALTRLCSADIVREDRRAGIRTEYTGRARLVDEMKFIFAAVLDVTPTVIATRGDRLVLIAKRVLGASADGGELDIDVLWLGEIDDGQRFARFVWFDADDLRGAIAELDDRYTAMLPEDHADAWMASCQLIDRYNARDNVSLRAILGDECVIIDERLTGWGELDGDAFVDHLQQLISVVPDAFLMCVVVHSTAPNGSAGRFRVTGTVPGGGPFEMLFETMSIVRDSKHVRLELLPEGRVEEALRRLSKAVG